MLMAMSEQITSSTSRIIIVRRDMGGRYMWDSSVVIRQPGCLVGETRGFASPPRDGFALSRQVGVCFVLNIGNTLQRLEGNLPIEGMDASVAGATTP